MIMKENIISKSIMLSCSGFGKLKIKKGMRKCILYSRKLRNRGRHNIEQGEYFAFRECISFVVHPSFSIHFFASYAKQM